MLNLDKDELVTQEIVNKYLKCEKLYKIADEINKKYNRSYDTAGISYLAHQNGCPKRMIRNKYKRDKIKSNTVMTTKSTTLLNIQKILNSNLDNELKETIIQSFYK